MIHEDSDGIVGEYIQLTSAMEQVKHTGSYGAEIRAVVGEATCMLMSPFFLISLRC